MTDRIDGNESVEDVLIVVFAAWDTYKSGYLSLEKFAGVMDKYDSLVENLAGKLLGEIING